MHSSSAPAPVSSPLQSRSLGDFDAYAGSYDKAVNDSLAFTGLSVDYFTRVKAGYIIDLFGASGALRSTHLLDVGCGVGNYHGLLAPEFERISGIDISSDCLRTARERHPNCDYRVFDGTNIPHETNAMGGAIAICVYHHVPPSLRAALTADVFRVLKPGARFVIFEHNPLNPLTMRVVNRCPFDADAVLLKRQDAEALLVQAGFQDVKSRFILSMPAHTAMLRRADRMFSRLPLGAQYFSTGLRP